MYCALLLKAGEYLRCQQIMYMIEGLDDTDKQLEEVGSGMCVCGGAGAAARGGNITLPAVLQNPAWPACLFTCQLRCLLMLSPLLLWTVLPPPPP